MRERNADCWVGTVPEGPHGLPDPALDLRWSFIIGRVFGITFRMHATFFLLLVFVYMGGAATGGSSQGMRAALAVEVYVGCSGRHVVHMAGRSQQTVLLHDAVTFGGLAVGVVVMAIIGRIARKAVEGAAAAAASATGQPPSSGAASVPAGEDME